MTKHYSVDVSMIGNLRLVSDGQLEELIADPGQVEDFLYESDEESRDEEDVDKAWQGLHFLFIGDRLGGRPAAQLPRQRRTRDR
jgi:hypothetical protein